MSRVGLPIRRTRSALDMCRWCPENRATRGTGVTGGQTPGLGSWQLGSRGRGSVLMLGTARTAPWRGPQPGRRQDALLIHKSQTRQGAPKSESVLYRQGRGRSHDRRSDGALGARSAGRAYSMGSADAAQDSRRTRSRGPDQRPEGVRVEPPLGIEPRTFSLRGGTTASHPLSTGLYSRRSRLMPREICHRHLAFHATTHATSALATTSPKGHVRLGGTVGRRRARRPASCCTTWRTWSAQQSTSHGGDTRPRFTCTRSGPASDKRAANLLASRMHQGPTLPGLA
jgi:hypothetical protein